MGNETIVTLMGEIAEGIQPVLSSPSFQGKMFYSFRKIEEE